MTDKTDFEREIVSDYITKDSGERKEFSTGMQRDTAEGKARYDLCIPQDCEEPMLKRWAELMGRGCEKYGARNWEKASTNEELERFRESAFRHFMQWFLGLEDGEDHASAIYFNIQGCEYVKEKLAKDCFLHSEVPA